MKSPNEPVSVLLDTDQAAAYLRKSPATLKSWRCLKSQPLAYIKSGHNVFYRIEDLDAYLERCHVEEVA